MALLTSFYSDWQNNFRLRVDVHLMSQDTTNNTSTVDYYSYIEAWPGYWFTSASITSHMYFDGGLGAADTQGRSVGSGGTVQIGSVRRNEWHNSDGTRTINLAFQAVANSVISLDVWAYANVTFPTIPRATTPNWSGEMTAGVAKTINLPRASSGFTHTVQYGFGTATGTIATGAGVTTSWTPPMSLLEQIPTAARGYGNIHVDTYSGGTKIGTRSVRFYLNADAGVVPSVSGVSWTDDNTTVASQIGAFLQGVSLIKGAFSAAGVYGSTIASKTLVIGATQVAEGVPIQVQGSGTVAASGQATDSRGRVGTLAAPFQVLAYTAPRVTAFQVRRATSGGVPASAGTYLQMNLTAAVQSLLVGGVQKNSMTIIVKTRPVGGAWTTRQTITPGLTYNTNVLVTGGGVFLAANSYEVRVEISDKAGQTFIAETTVGTGTVTLDLNGTRVGVGKFHEFGGLDVAEQINDRAGITSPVGAVSAFAGSAAPRGWLLCDGSAVSRTAYAELFAVLGTTYGAGNGSSTFNLPDLRGRVPAGLSSETEFVALGKAGGTKTHTLTVAEMPSHRHGPGDGASHVVSFGAGNGMTWDGGTAFRTTDQGGATGGGQPHPNLQPYLTLNFIIRA